MSVLDDIGICRQSGCEATAIQIGNEILFLGRPALFKGLNLEASALKESQLLRNYLAAARSGERQNLLDLYQALTSSSSDFDKCVEYFANHLGTGLVAYRVPLITNGENGYSLAIRTPTVVELSAMERMLRVLNIACEKYVGAQLREQLSELFDPQNILVTAASLVAIAAVTGSGVGTAVMTGVGFVLKGWEIFNIVRGVIHFVEAFLAQDEENAARELGAAIASLGLAAASLFIRRVGARVRRPRPNLQRPTDEPSFQEISVTVGLDVPRAPPPGRSTFAQQAQSAVEDARAAGFIDATGNPRGNVGAAVQPHRRMADVRNATGHSGLTRQSAHIGATSLLRSVPGYSRNDALTQLMDPVSHRQFDSSWMGWVRQRRRGGDTTASLADVLAVQRHAIDGIVNMTQQQRNTLQWLLEREIMGLASNTGSGLGTMIPLPVLR